MKINDIKKEYKKIFYIEDDRVIDVLTATVLGTWTKTEPIWLLLVGASSGGKSELINMFGKVKGLHYVDELTEASFLSGLNQEGASLLDRIGNIGCLAMKDFTSILNMRPDKREIIIGQMRHIYDGKISKITGNNKNPTWVGKVNFIGGVTDSVYTVGESSSDMGRRTINYYLPTQNRQITTSYAKQNKKRGGMAKRREYIQDLMSEYMEEMKNNLPAVLPDIPKEQAANITTLSDFCTQARTPVQRNFQGEVILVNDFEMPMRVDGQAMAIAEVIAFMYDEQVPKEVQEIPYQICLHSIPKQRLIALKKLTEYENVTTNGLATHLNYPTNTVARWLEDLNAVEIVVREIDSITKMNIWSLKPEYKSLMIKFGGIKPKEEKLRENTNVDSSSEVFEDMDPGTLLEMSKNNNNEAEAIFDALNSDDDW